MHMVYWRARYTARNRRTEISPASSGMPRYGGRDELPLRQAGLVVDDWGRLAQGDDLRMGARRKLPVNFRHWDEAAL
jgi:hypothetical protein